MKDFMKILLVIAVIALICVASYALNEYMGEDKPTGVEGNNSNTSSINQQNTVSNNEKNETVPEENNVIEDENNKNSEEEKNVEEETNLSDDDKAIELAKKEYGSTDGVYFRIEQMQSNKVYIISVRDKETTRDLAWYTVDVKNGTVK